MQVWGVKHDHLRVGAPCWDDDSQSWIGLGTGPTWRGPSNPRDTVYHVPAGDLIVVYDIHDECVWEAGVSLGRVTVETWFDHVDEKDVTQPALWYDSIASFACDLSYEGLRAFKQMGQTTLFRVKPELGFEMFHEIVDAAVIEVLDPALKERG